MFDKVFELFGKHEDQVAGPSPDGSPTNPHDRSSEGISEEVRRHKNPPQLLVASSEALLKRLGLLPQLLEISASVSDEEVAVTPVRSLRTHLRSALLYAELRLRWFLLKDSAAESETPRIAENARMFGELYGLLTSLEPDGGADEDKTSAALAGIWSQVEQRMARTALRASDLRKFSESLVPSSAEEALAKADEQNGGGSRGLLGLGWSRRGMDDDLSGGSMWGG